MTNLVMIPAFGCDERLYAAIAPLLPANVLTSTLICDGDTFAACVEQVLARAPEQFVILGTSFGGRVALIGPSGAGKTSAIARLAARWVMRHGPSQVALVCADEQRLGARLGCTFGGQ